MNALPSFLSDDQKDQINSAVRKNKPILVTGSQGPTGKSTLVQFLKENGITAFEEWECERIDLTIPLSRSNSFE